MITEDIDREAIIEYLKELDDPAQTLEKSLKTVVEEIRSSNPILVASEFAYLAKSTTNFIDPEFPPRELAYLLHLLEKNYISKNAIINKTNDKSINSIGGLIHQIIICSALNFSKQMSDTPLDRAASIQHLQDLCITGKGYHKIRRDIFINIYKRSNLPSALINGNELYHFIDKATSFQQKKINRLRLQIQKWQQKIKNISKREIIENERQKMVVNRMPYCFEISHLEEEFEQIFKFFSTNLSNVNVSVPVEIRPASGYTYSEKPIWKIGKHSYFFNIIEFEDNLFAIYCNYLSSFNESYKTTFCNARDKYVESHSAEIIAKSINADILIKNAKYELDGTSYEADAIIIVENELFIVEAKASKFRPASLKGARLSLRKQLNESLRYANEQADRVILAMSKRQRLHISDGTTNFTLDAASFDKAHKIIIIYEDLSPHIASNKDLIEEGILSRENTPWVVALHDLIALSEVLDRPDLFLLYIQMREELNKRFDLSFHDEMEILGYFMKERAHLPEKCGKNMRMIYYSNEIDAFFEGRKKKPIFDLPSTVDEFLTYIFTTKILGWVNFVKAVLSFDINSIHKLATFLKQCSINECENNVFTTIFNNEKLAIIMQPENTDMHIKNHKKLADYVHYIRLKYRLPRHYFIVFYNPDPFLRPIAIISELHF